MLIKKELYYKTLHSPNLYNLTNQTKKVYEIKWYLYRAPRLLKVPETTQPGTLIESFHIRENLQVYRGVHCHLEPPEARKYFDLDPGYNTNVKDISKCDMKLMKKLDYEARSAFIIQIVAEVKYFVIMFLIQFSKLISLKISLIKCFST